MPSLLGTLSDLFAVVSLAIPLPKIENSNDAEPSIATAKTLALRALLLPFPTAVNFALVVYPCSGEFQLFTSTGVFSLGARIAKTKGVAKYVNT